MGDGLLAAVGLVELIVIASAIFVFYKVARLTGRPPLGWNLLAVAYSVAMVRAVIFLYLFSETATSVDTLTAAGQILTLPVAVLILGGVYLIYLDFKKVMESRQSSLLVQSDPSPAPENKA